MLIKLSSQQQPDGANPSHEPMLAYHQGPLWHSSENNFIESVLDIDL